MCVICISFRWAIDVNVLGWVVLSVDLRDAVGDRLYLSKSFTRDGVSTFVANTILPLTIPTDPLRRQPSYFTQVRHPLLSSSPSLINLPYPQTENTLKPSRPGKPSPNPANLAVSYRPSSGGVGPRSDRRITINQMGVRVAFMGRWRLRKLLVSVFFI